MTQGRLAGGGVIRRLLPSLSAGRRAKAGLRQAPYFVVIPALILVLAIHVAPTVIGGGYAFTNWDGLSAHAKYIGFANFQEIFSDPTARSVLTHTFVIAGAFVIATNVLGLCLAMGLNAGLKTRSLLRSLFFLPAVFSPIAVSFVWKYILSYDGAVNSFLGAIGLSSWERAWLSDPTWAIWCIVLVMVWQYAGLTMIVYLAGLQSISTELQEAASVDGARTWYRFRHVTLPLLAPAITINATLMLIFGFRVFDQVLALTGGGPVNATETLATQVYKQAFQLGRFGYSAALAVLLTAIIAVLTVIQMVVLRARERRMA